MFQPAASWLIVRVWLPAASVTLTLTVVQS
jgi:hypothetical protein